MSLESEMNNFHLIDKVQNKMKLNTLYGLMCSPMSNNADELERIKSELNSEIEIQQIFFKPFKNQTN